MTSRSSERMTSVSESAMLWRSGIDAAYLGPGLRAAGPSRTVAPIPSASRARAARADASSPAEASVLKMTSSTRAVRVLAVGPGFSRGAGSEGGDCGCSCSGVAGGRPKLPKGAAAVTALSLSADAAGPPGGQTAAKDRVCGTAPPISDAPLQPAMISADINMRTGHAVRREMVCRASRSKLLSSASTSKRRTGRLNCNDLILSLTCIALRDAPCYLAFSTRVLIFTRSLSQVIRSLTHVWCRSRTTRTSMHK